MLTEQQQALLFASAPAGPTWIGSPAAVDIDVEAVPFKFDSLRYVMVFMHPSAWAGADEVPSYASSWADGYLPSNTARLIKFWRAEAAEEMFNPRVWRLNNRAGIFQFGEFLRDAWTQHHLAVPETEQYFYMATDGRLANFYGRIVANSTGNASISGFEPIAEPLGGFYGYRKKN